MAPTIQQKVERLKEELGLDAALSIKDAIQEANNIVGLQAVGSLGDQLDKLIAELGINLTPEESTPNARAAGAGLDAARKRNIGPMVPSAPNHASSGRPQPQVSAHRGLGASDHGGALRPEDDGLRGGQREDDPGEGPLREDEGAPRREA